MPSKYPETQLILAAGAEGLSLQRESSFVSMESADVISRFEAAGLWFGPRAVLEESEHLRQIIPYVVLQIGSRFVRYTRTTSSNEARLHGKVSIGLGGHVDLTDVLTNGAQIDLLGTLERAAEREVLEELGGVECERRRWIGLLIDNATPVSRVHVGFVALWRLRSLPGKCAEEAIGEVSTETIAELKNISGRLETWSEMLLPYLEATTSGMNV